MYIGLNEWVNHWFDVYDFTPAAEPNFKFLPPSVNHTIMLNPAYIGELADTGLGPGKSGTPTILQTCGPQYRGEMSKAGLIITPCRASSKSEVRNVLDVWTRTRGNVIIRTTIKALSRDQLQDVLGTGLGRKVNEMLKIPTEPPSPTEKCVCLIVEISGDDFERVERGFLLPGTILLAGPKAVDKSNQIFDEWKEKV